MLIESLIRRKNGTTVTFGRAPAARTYKFVATPPDPRHVCEVENEEDIGDLLAIKEGYRIAKGSTAKAAAEPPAAQKPAPAAQPKQPAAPPQK